MKIFSYSDVPATNGWHREYPSVDVNIILNLGDEIEIQPTTGSTLRVPQGNAFVAGLHLSPAFSASRTTQFGVQIRISVIDALTLFGSSLADISNRVALLSDLSPSAANALSRSGAKYRLGASEFIKLRKEVPAEVDAAIRLITARPHVPIQQVADRLGWTRKRLAGEVRGACGLSPKSLQSLDRFTALRASIDSNEAASLSELAAEHSYFDHAHMANEFKRFAGLAPSAYRSGTS